MNELYDYLDGQFTFQLTVCFGGFSVCIWQGDQQNQSAELGLWPTREEAIRAAVAWCDLRKAKENSCR